MRAHANITKTVAEVVREIVESQVQNFEFSDHFKSLRIHCVMKITCNFKPSNDCGTLSLILATVNHFV